MTAHATLLATTVLHRQRLDETPYTAHDFPSPTETVMAADELAEFAGRSSNQSWERPNPDTRLNRDYLREVIRRGYFEFLEHASATFWITGVSRSLSHEFLRYRDLVCTELSQRHVDSWEATFVVPTVFDDETRRLVFGDILEYYEYLRGRARANGLSGNAVREAANAVLPNCTETTLLVTGTMHAWREVICGSFRADDEVHSLSQELLRQLKQVAPNSFQDLPTSELVEAAVSTILEPVSAYASALQFSATLRSA